MGPECACGCGEFLPEGSTREYKRGHRNRGATFTIDDADIITPKDEEPEDNDDSAQPEPPVDKPRRTRMSKRVQKDIEGQLAWGLAMMGTVWALRDQPCGGTLVDSAPNIAEKLAPIMCRSPKVVDFFTKSKGFGFAEYVELVMAFGPLAQMMYAHHFAPKMNPDIPVDAQAPVYAA